MLLTVSALVPELKSPGSIAPVHIVLNTQPGVPVIQFVAGARFVGVMKFVPFIHAHAVSSARMLIVADVTTKSAGKKKFWVKVCTVLFGTW